ncbi:MAG: fibrillarin-like rRNA/tRNA 2'-O-methyltransferase [Candidatus Micrarchaeota archaeon]
MQQVFPGVYKVDGKLATKSIAPGFLVYKEDIKKAEGSDFRIWEPKRSKIGAAIVKGLRQMPIKPGSKVLYLGAASGTTASHVSDIVGASGEVYCVEFSAQVARQLVEVCQKRANMLPIVEDARFPERYGIEGKVNVVFEDVADRAQVQILVENCKAFLEPHGFAMIAIKARCIDSSAPSQQVYSRVVGELMRDFDVLEKIDLRPFELDHLFLVLRAKA